MTKTHRSASYCHLDKTSIWLGSLAPVCTYVCRTFWSPGYNYILSLTSRNMHAVNSTDIIMTWNILCANPVDPTLWNLGYSPSQYYGTVRCLEICESASLDSFNVI